MSAKKRPHPNSSAVESGERVPDASAGLERMKDTLRHLLKVPKSAVQTKKVKSRGSKGNSS
jgi:hypothetical protein